MQFQFLAIYKLYFQLIDNDTSLCGENVYSMRWWKTALRPTFARSILGLEILTNARTFFAKSSTLFVNIFLSFYSLQRHRSSVFLWKIFTFFWGSHSDVREIFSVYFFYCFSIVLVRHFLILLVFLNRIFTFDVP